MKTNRPTSLTVVAWLFILVGILAVVSTAARALSGTITLNSAVLALPGGIGLLRVRRGWRMFCLCALCVGVLGSVLLSAGAIYSPQKIHLPGLGVPSPYFVVLVAVASTLVYVWAYWVLTRKDVCALFGVESDVSQTPNQSLQPTGPSARG